MLDKKFTSVFVGESSLGSVVGLTGWLVGESVCGGSARSSLIFGIKYVTTVTPIKIMTAKSINFQFALSHLLFVTWQGVHSDVQSTQVLSFVGVWPELLFE